MHRRCCSIVGALYTV